MRIRSQSVGFGVPLTVATIATGTGLALWLAISVVGRMQLTTPEFPRIIPSVEAPASPTSGDGITPSTTAAPADNLGNPGSSAVPRNAPAGAPPATTPAPPTGPSGPAQPERPQRIYGDMPIDPPLVNPNPRPVEE